MGGKLSAVAGAGSVGPEIAESESAESEVAEPESAEPESVESETAESESAESESAEPESAEPQSEAVAAAEPEDEVPEAWLAHQRAAEFERYRIALVEDHGLRRLRAYVVGGTLGVGAPVVAVWAGYLHAENEQWNCAINCITSRAAYAHEVIGDFPLMLVGWLAAAFAYSRLVEGIYRRRMENGGMGRPAKGGTGRTPRARKEDPPSKLAWLLFFVGVFGTAIVLGVLRGFIINSFGH
jgi:hypothetical protein